MYQEHFRLNSLPFALTPDTHFFCEAHHHQAALNTLLVCLQQGEGFIKITGEIGSGKTLLCRLLLNRLDLKRFFTVYIPNPHLMPNELLTALAKELSISNEIQTDPHHLQEMIHQKLLDINQQGQTVVIIIDEAQTMPVESLEALRLISNLETETHKLMQVVLFGQPELDHKLNRHELRQLKQRIAFRYYLKPLNYPEMLAYLQRRLAIAGHTYGPLFNRGATKLLFKYSHGIPRVINILAHKSLLVAYGRGIAHVNEFCVKQALKDTDLVDLGYRSSGLKKVGRAFLKWLRPNKRLSHEFD